VGRQRINFLNSEPIMPPQWCKTAGNSFISDYMEYMECSETPHGYDFWCAIWLISYAVGRAVQVARPTAPVFLNWYVVLTAESGITRKSSAVRAARDLAVALAIPKRFMIESKTTPEGLMDRIVDACISNGCGQGALVVSEMVTFFGREAYSAAMPGILTDLYDCPAHRLGGGTRNTTIRELRDVWLTVLTASTPAWLSRAINPSIIEGGFTSRTMFIVEPKRKKTIAWGKVESTIPQSRLLEHLQAIRARVLASNGLIQLTPDAIKRFEGWYRRRSYATDAFRGSFESREDAHVLRLAACLALNDLETTISLRHLNNAISIINEVKQRSALLFGGSYNYNEMLGKVQKVREKLVEAGRDGITQTDIAQAVKRHLKATELTTVLRVMCDMGLIQEFQVHTTNAKKVTKLWRATTELVKKNATELVIKRLSQT
jgi:hypothetical protein